MLNIPLLEGTFFRLEPLRADHRDGLLNAATTGPRDTFRYTLVPDYEASIETYIQTALSWQSAGTAMPFAIFDKRAGQIVGSTRFFDLQYWDWKQGNPNQRGADLPDALEVGYTWLTPTAQRTAINTEMKLLMLTHAFEVWAVYRVRLATDARNTRSRNAIERLGAHLDGVLRAAREGTDGEIRDSAYYSILDSEWPGVKRALEARLRRD